MREALGYFEQALALDQDYALARAALATGAAWFSVRYAYEADALTWGKRADAEARRALEQDPHLADAHLAIASAAGTQFGGFNWKVVLDRTAEALELDPSLDLAHVVRMRALYHLGVFEEAAAEAARARALNPFPNAEIARLEVAIQLFAGHFSVAEQLASDLLARDRSNLPAVPHYLGLARYYLGDVTGAREMLASAMRGGRPDVRAQATLASIEASAGMVDQARARIASIVGGSYMDHHVAYSLGAAYAQLRDADAGVTWLQRAADTGFSCYPWFARDPLLDPIRSHSPFSTLLDRLRREQEPVVSQAQ
jgi:tetratricopeptide (TPR) repeat protein